MCSISCAIALSARLFLTVALCIATVFLGAGTPASSAEGSFRVPAARELPLDAGPAQAVALASGDFDEDGVADLISGYTSPDGNVLMLQRGNGDSIFPNSPAARQRRLQGTFSDEPFLPSVRVFQAPVRPDFLVAGDFDNDGHSDVALAASGGASLYLLPGDGNGGLGRAEPLKLIGTVTTLVAGEINRADGLVDLVVGVRGPEGPALLVFEGPEGALRSVAEVLPLSAAPTELLLGRFVNGPWHDLAAAAGEELFLVRGRDRRLVLGEAERAEVAPPVVDRIVMPSAIEALAWGNFAWEPIATHELALLLEDGTIRLLGRAQTENHDLDPLWKTIGEREVLAPRLHAAESSSVRLLLPVRISGSPTEDLAILDAIDGRLEVLAGMVREDAATHLADPGVVVSIDMQQPPIAALGMRLNRDALTDLVLLRQGLGGPLVVETAPLAAITVNSAADSTATDGTCTLREALNNSNSNSDTTGGDCVAGAGTDTIMFSIGGGGSTATIAPTSALPVITDPVTIDGTTQGCASPPCVVLDGSGAGVVPAGLSLGAGSSSIRGLVIHSFLGDGVSGTLGLGILVTSSGNFVEGNYSGTNATGTVALGNSGAGLRIDDGSSNVVGGTTSAARNLISAAVGGHGVNINQISGTATDNQVLGNLIGTDVSGTIDLGNFSAGVRINAPSNTIGGTGVGARNIISGNEDNGVLLSAASAAAQGNLVLGNFVGTDISGTVALPNGADNSAVWVGVTNNTIGGASVGARNLISGNPLNGVHLTGSGHQVLGNYIGTDVTGTVDLGNAVVGVRILDGQDNIIGGTTEGARNIISGNESDGVVISGASSQSNFVLGNYIGTDVTGTADLGNSDIGVYIFNAPNNTVGGAAAGAGNVISGNETWGVAIYVSNATGNVVLGNLIGTDLTGTVALGNTLDGIIIQEAANNTIGGTADGAGNVIAGNRLGIYLFAPTTTGNLVQGNFIGTDLTGTVALGNLYGVVVEQAANNTIGGTIAAARNIISGNDEDGVFFGLSAQDNIVLGNFIGTDVTGKVDLGNGIAGVEIQFGSNNTIGGTADGARNVISGNDQMGVLLELNVTTQNSVLGNFIGTDVTGTIDLGNSEAGVWILGGSSNTIGGTTPGARNVISGNDWEGVAIGNASDNEILGNFIGTQADGVSPLGNALHGINVYNGSSNNKIGGTGVTPGMCDGPCNRIGFTQDPANDGVNLQPGAGNGNAILGNSIFDCGELGIDLASNGMSANDVGDPDTGPNTMQNYPVLSVAVATPLVATVDGSLNSMAGRSFRLEFFANGACDASGHGEGSRFLGFTNVLTDGTGNVSFSVALTGPVSDGEAITATASMTTGFSTSTSEFSECLAATCTSTAVFGQTVLAQDKNTLSWGTPDHARFVKGDLTDVSSYLITATGELPMAMSLDISADHPGAGAGLYYLIRSLACGSWQTTPGAEPGRNVLP